MEHVVNAPLCGKPEAIIDRGHHLNYLEGAVAFGREFRGWLVGAQVASFQPHLITHLISGRIFVLDP